MRRKERTREGEEERRGEEEKSRLLLILEDMQDLS